MFIFVREAIPMLVSTKGRYALRVMLELAQSDSAVYSRVQDSRVGRVKTRPSHLVSAVSITGSSPALRAG